MDTQIFKWLSFPTLFSLCIFDDISIGQIDLNLKTILDSGVLFYTGNLHKWGFAPRGCAVLWSSPTVRESVRPLVISHNAKKGYHEEFYMQVLCMVFVQLIENLIFSSKLSIQLNLISDSHSKSAENNSCPRINFWITIESGSFDCKYCNCKQNFLRSFFQGTVDYSNYLAVEGAIAFNRSLGGTRAIQAYADGILVWAQEMLVQALGTEALPVPRSMEAPYMRSLGKCVDV